MSNVFLSRTSEQNKKICLVMIVKNEEDVIERCLSSVAPYISYWVIVDTGSSDNTISKIKEVMEGFNIPGEIHERPWIDFGSNRTESLELAKDKCDYRWVIDADDYFQPLSDKNPFQILSDDVDCYKFFYQLNGLQYYRAQMVKSNQDWVYEGVLHEYLAYKGNPEGSFQDGNIIDSAVIASISPFKRASSLEEKYLNDSKVLHKALEKEPNNARYVFYLAQSYRDAGKSEESIYWYKKRVNLGGWQEEVYYSLYMIAKLNEKLGADSKSLVEMYTQAWEYRPFRLEACYHAMRHLRNIGHNYLAYTYGLAGSQNPGCKDILFIEQEVWQWRFIDEFSLAAFFSGYPQKSVELTQKLLASDTFKIVPQPDSDRIRKNMDYFVKSLSQGNLSLKDNPVFYEPYPETETFKFTD